ncbi:MAG: HD domain-containing protein [Lentisphaerae bacterium]|nr:HD domain-containing protein [Lentisphaerota bacterium]
MTTVEKVKEIAHAIARAGGRTMLAGGCVRDSILNIPVKDFDLEVYRMDSRSLLDTLKNICEVDAVGMSFGVLKVKHFDIDIALPRKENKSGAGHRGFIVEVSPEMDFADAASRRDFTINAIMQDAITGEIIDPWHGQKDLQNRVLRHVSPAFTEDPLRVLRGMQFIARFDLTADNETVQLCSTLSQDELPIERLSAEWEKLLLKGINISAGLNFLRDCRWIRYYPALEALTACPQDPRWHPEGSVWNHTLKVTDAAAAMRDGSPDDLILMLAALCHDFGKPACTVIQSDGRITSCGHDTFLEPAEKFISSIWRRKDLPEKVLPLIAHHMHPWQLVENDASDKAFRKLALQTGNTGLLAKIARADVMGIDGSKENLARQLHNIELFSQRCHALAIADAAPKPLILGRHLLQYGMKPGKDFKPLLDACFEAQLSGEFADLPGALNYLDKLLCGK